MLQFLFCCIKSYIFDGVLLPFSLSHIFTQFLLPSKSPALTIWYMHLLVVTTAILPLLVRFFSTIGFWMCFVLPYILSFFLPMNYSLERLCHTIPVVLLGYRFGPPLESTDKKLIMLSGIIWLSSIGFFIAYETRILGDSYFSINNETPIFERLTYQNIITFTFVHLNHIFGFYFWMNVVGVILGKYKKLQRQLTHYAFSSIDIYLIHKPYLTFLFGLFLIGPLMSILNLRASLLVFIVNALFAFLICLCSVKIGTLMRKSQWLAFIAFGKPIPSLKK